MGKAEQKNGLRSKPGRASAIVTDWSTHRRSASRNTQPVPAHLGADAAAGREVGIDLLLVLEPAARVGVLLGAHGAPDEVRVG